MQEAEFLNRKNRLAPRGSGNKLRRYEKPGAWQDSTRPAVKE